MTTTSDITLAVNCPDCGHVEAPIDTAVVTVHGTERRCTFVCPLCTVPAASRLLSQPLVDAIVAEGVPTVTLPLRTLPAETLPTFTVHDVIEITCQFAATDDLAGAQ